MDKKIISQGHPRLVSAISQLYSKLLNIEHEINPNTEVLVTDGAYEALFTGKRYFEKIY